MYSRWLLIPEQFGEHNANDVNAIRHGDPGQFLYRQHVRHFVNAAAEDLDTVVYGM